MSQDSIAAFDAFLANNPIGNRLHEEERVREQEARRRLMLRSPVITQKMRNRRQELIDQGHNPNHILYVDGGCIGTVRLMTDAEARVLLD